MKEPIVSVGGLAKRFPCFAPHSALPATIDVECVSLPVAIVLTAGLELQKTSFA
jgi:hypothetical protein